MGALSEFIDREFGVKTRQLTNPLVDEVDTGITQVLGNNPDRLAWVIVNLSANLIFLAFDTEVATTHGIRLAANGGTISTTAKEDMELVSMPVWAIAAADDSDIFVSVVEAE